MSSINTLVVPAAGLGTRMLPASYVFPKELLPIVDVPIILHTVEEALEVGVDHFVFVISRGKESITQFFDPPQHILDALENKGKIQQVETFERLKKNCRMSIVYQDNPKGLGHAILQARDCVGEKPFYVSLPDMLVPGGLKSLQRLHKMNPNISAKLCLKSVVDTASYGVAINPMLMSDEVIMVESFVEKPSAEIAHSNLAILGRYCFTKEIWSALAATQPGRNGEIQLTDAINLLPESKACVEITDLIEDTGDPAGWLAANLRAGLRDERYATMIKKIIRQELVKK